MLKRFTLKKDDDLHDQLGDRVRRFKTKAEALEGGVLEKLGRRSRAHSSRGRPA